jgi:membrane protease YdiL (CAAX protease family)
MSEEQPAQALSAGPPAPQEPPVLPPPPPQRDPFWTWGDVLLFIGLAVASWLVGGLLVAGVAILARVHMPGKVGTPELLAAQAMIYVLAFGSLALLFRIQYDRPFWRSLGWCGFRMPAVQVALLGVATAYAVSFLGTLIRTPTTPNEITKLLDDPQSLILMAVFGITLAPVCEELAFRGFLQPLLVRTLGVAPGIVAAALPFGLLHYREYGNSWRHAVIVAAAGAAFGWMRHRTGSTIASSIMHAAYNALFFAAMAGQKTHLWR